MTTNFLRMASGAFILFSACSLLSVSLIAFSDPQSVMDLVSVKLNNTDAFSSIRGVYGGVGLTLFISLVYLVWKDHQSGLALLSLLWGFYAVSRAITIMVEGPLGVFGTQWIIIETILFGIAVLLFFAEREKQDHDMKKFDSKVLLTDLEQKAEQHIRQAITVFQNLPEELLNRPSSTRGWSIAQCLWHLNSYGNYYLPQIKNGLDKNYPPVPVFKSTWLGTYFTRMMEPGTSMKKYKAFNNHVPPKTLQAHEVVATFIHQQETLLQYMKQAQHTDLNAVKIPVSIARFIRLKLGDVLGFLVAHNQRHLQQAARNLDDEVNRAVMLSGVET